MKATPTTERVPALVGEPARPRTIALTLLVPLLLGLLTLLPRALGLADFLTTDEAYHWITRTERFAAAIAAGAWAGTDLTGHPGVTLMWLGSLGLSFERLALGAGWVAAPDRLTHLAWLRLGPVLAHALAIPAAYLLLRRLVRAELALVAALLWATSPFLVAHGRLLHLDALLTSLATLTVLATLVACHAERPRPWLLLTGVLCGLALLTKGPALILLPWIGLAMFARGGGARWTAASPQLLVRQLRWSIPRYLLLLAVAALTALLLWPALWAVPERALASYWGEIVGNGGRANGDGQFFLGSANPDPGPLFYPLAALFRLTPLELLGLILACGFALSGLRFTFSRAAHLPSAEKRHASVNHKLEPTTLLALAAFAFWWLLVMTAGPKKFDRYILPLWPVLLTLAAYGLVEGWAWVGRRLDAARAHRTRSRAYSPGALAALLVLQGALLAWYHPHFLSYYNPLLGGGPVAQRSFLIGWGEGMEQVGAWLRARPDIASGQVVSALPPTLQPFVPVPVRLMETIDDAPANYAVVYLESLQRGALPDVYARVTETLPLHTVRIHGITYATIHQLARPFATPVEASFGDALRLRGYTATVEEGQLLITPSWDVRAAPPSDLMLFVHLLAADGKRVTGIDVPPGGAALPPTSQWQPGQQIAVPLPLSLPADLPAGSYTLTLGLYEPTSFTRLPLTAGTAADPAVAGDNAALLGQVELP